MKDSALTRRLAAIVRKYIDDDDMLEELGTKGEIERYVWRIVNDPSDDEVLEVAVSYMKSNIDKGEFFEVLNTDRLAERAKRVRKERPVY